MSYSVEQKKINNPNVKHKTTQGKKQQKQNQIQS